MVRIAVIPGDGIGPEVTAEAIKVLHTVAACAGKDVDTVHFDYGAERYVRDGVSLPSDALHQFRTEFDALLLGALGDPRVAAMTHAIDILFGLPLGFDLFRHVRPVKL